MSIPTDFLPSFYANQTIALIASPQPFRVYHRQKQNAYYQHHRLDHRQERRKTGAYRALRKLINVHADLHENSAYSQRAQYAAHQKNQSHNDYREVGHSPYPAIPCPFPGAVVCRDYRLEMFCRKSQSKNHSREL